jgi:glycosyltransferase involved in cell wall biosynthesis
MPPLRVAIDARRLRPGSAGGVEQIMIGLAHGLSSLEDGDEEYFFLTPPSDPRWIEPYLSGRCRVLQSAGSLEPPRWRARLANVRPLRAAWEMASPIIGPRTIPIPQSDGTIERARIDVIHFPQQGAFLTSVPSIYQPHDLQHLHLPRYFSRRTRLAREVSYRTFCAQAAAVVMMTHWGRRDLIDAYALPDDRVCVVPGASVLSAYPAPSSDDMLRIRREHRLPDSFVLFPAQTFPHKNHLMLLEALAIARDRQGITIPLVATGHQNHFFSQIAKRADSLALGDQVCFVGFVSPVDLRAIYRSARCLIFPSAFEGWGLPVVEAFAEGIPVACADATSLPEVAGDAALLFPPDDASLLADAIVRLWTDEALRAELVQKGSARIATLSWQRTARIFRAHYRRIGRVPLGDGDESLIAESFGRRESSRPT